MIKSISSGVLFGSALITCILMGVQGAHSEDVQPQEEPSTNFVGNLEDELLEETESSHAEEDGIITQPSVLPDTIDPNSPVAELVRMVQAGVGESVMLAYINNSLHIFSLDADNIIYLNDIGTPAKVIEAIIEHDQDLIQKGISGTSTQPETPAEDLSDPPVEEVTDDYFYDTLSPYGAWVYIDGYGRCWRPTVVVHNSGWRPYCDNGRWVYTDHGWYWYSGYSWGYTTFHYGRWFNHARYGWCWWPDRVWAPSWVYWRYNSNHCGWAPLPPHTTYRSGIGFVYRGSRVSVGFDFGLGANSFTFVSIRNFCDPSPWRYRVRDSEARTIYNGTVVYQTINYDSNNRTVVNTGIPTTEITSVTHQEINPVSVRYNRERAGRGGQGEQLDRSGRVMHVNRPIYADAESSTSSQGQTSRSAGRRQGSYQTSMDGGGTDATVPSSTQTRSSSYRTGAQSYDSRQSTGGARGYSGRLDTTPAQSAPASTSSAATRGSQRRSATSYGHPRSNSSGAASNRSGGSGQGSAQQQSRRTESVSTGVGAQTSRQQPSTASRSRPTTPPARTIVTPSKRRNVPNYNSGNNSKRVSNPAAGSSTPSTQTKVPPKGSNNSTANSSRRSSRQTRNSDESQQ